MAHAPRSSIGHQIIRLAHTIRHLKARQIRSQLARRLWPMAYRIKPSDGTGTETLPSSVPAADTPVLTPTPGANSAKHILSGILEFLNERREIGFPPRWADSRLASKLWDYNLHYFDWLHVLDFPAAKVVIQDWIKQHPPEAQGIAWDPYPTSLRCLNWTLYFFVNHHQCTADDPKFGTTLWPSLCRQANFLSHNLETHILGNHLFENIAALAFMGCVFKGPQAKNWYRVGFRELTTEIPEQFPPDGLHFEKAPMYHLRLTYLLCLLCATRHPELLSLCKVPLHRALEALEKVCHPDGQIALLNDSAFGIYHSPETVTRYGKRLLKGDYPEQSKTNSSPSLARSSSGPWSLSDAGYYGFRDEKGNFVICDVGSVGPDYIPGHAHADMLTYELSLEGCRVIVDTGIHNYLNGPIRHECRATRAHNTVEIEGQDQCDCWGAFRLGRRGYPQNVAFSPLPDGFRLSAAHSGYFRSPLRATHHRTFELSTPFKLSIHDQISAPQSVRSISFVHLAPQCTLVELSEQRATIQYPKGQFYIDFVNMSEQAEIKQTTSPYYPEFGITQMRTCLSITAKGKYSELSYTITKAPEPLSPTESTLR